MYVPHQTLLQCLGSQRSVEPHTHMYQQCTNSCLITSHHIAQAHHLLLGRWLYLQLPPQPQSPQTLRHCVDFLASSWRWLPCKNWKALSSETHHPGRSAYRTTATAGDTFNTYALWTGTAHATKEELNSKTTQQGFSITSLQVKMVHTKLSNQQSDQKNRYKSKVSLTVSDLSPKLLRELFKHFSPRHLSFVGLLQWIQVRTYSVLRIIILIFTTRTCPSTLPPIQDTYVVQFAQYM